MLPNSNCAPPGEAPTEEAPPPPPPPPFGTATGTVGVLQNGLWGAWEWLPLGTVQYLADHVDLLMLQGRQVALGQAEELDLLDGDVLLKEKIYLRKSLKFHFSAAPEADS